MTAPYKQTVTDLMANLGWGDLELADFYNSVNGTAHPAPIYKHVRDDAARKLIAAMGVELERRWQRKAKY